MNNKFVRNVAKLLLVPAMVCSFNSFFVSANNDKVATKAENSSKSSIAKKLGIVGGSVTAGGLAVWGLCKLFSNASSDSESSKVYLETEQ